MFNIRTGALALACVFASILPASGQAPAPDRAAIEAIVRQDNEHSNKIASRTLDSSPKSIVDGVSKEPAFQYFMKVNVEA